MSKKIIFKKEKPKKKNQKSDKASKHKQNHKNLPLKFTQRQGAYAIDGHGINVRSKNNIELNFIQIQNKHNNHIDAIGVTAVRMNIEQMKSLYNDLKNALKDIETQEKKK